MPKKTKSKSNGVSRGARVDNTGLSDDDSVFNDDASVVSNASSGTYMKDEGEENNEDLSGDELFEEKLREAMDMASQKSATGRTNALRSLCNAFLKRQVPEFVEERRLTLCDIVDRALKRGKGQEQQAAAGLAILICVQLGLSASTEDVYKELQSTLTTLMLDPAQSAKSRGAMALALGLLCFLTCDVPDFKDILENLEKVFKPSCVEGANLKPEITAMHTEALSTWTTLLTVMSPSKSMNFLENHIDNLSHVLDSADVDLRIAAGEAIVVLYENAVEVDEEDAYSLVESVIDQLKQLATDSQKFRSKKDRKEQKSSFRDFLKTIEENEDYYEKVNINNREVLEIVSWSQKCQYDSLCKVLSSGMNFYLTENELVRDVFQLGPPAPALSEINSSKPSKLERHTANQLAMKIRNQARGKHRDKRSAVV